MARRRRGASARQFATWATLGGAGFYLAGQTTTFARDLGLNAGTLRKILAFHRRNPDDSALQGDTPWRRGRDGRVERLDEGYLREK